MPEASDLAAAVTALRPLGQWFLVHSAMTGLVVWSFASKKWDEWPLPLQIVVWSWLVATAFIVLIMTLNGIVTFLYEWWHGSSPLPTAPAPGPPLKAASAVSGSVPSGHDPT